jgi:choline dehydrogenase
LSACGTACAAARACAADSFRAIATRVEYGSTGRSIDEVLDAADLDDWLFAECSDAQHASGTCRMGARDDPHSVVDPDCRVIGCTGLRVIDDSVVPEVVRANTDLTTVMMAERWPTGSGTERSAMRERGKRWQRHHG